jgi:hypothetical protein
MRFSFVIFYQVSISPFTSCTTNHAVLRELVNKHREVGLQLDCFAYDGDKILYTPEELNLGSSWFEITLQDEEECHDSTGAYNTLALKRYMIRLQRIYNF